MRLIKRALVGAIIMAGGLLGGCNAEPEIEVSAAAKTSTPVKYQMAANAAQGTVTFLVNGKAVTSAAAGRAVYLRVTPNEGYRLVEGSLTYVSGGTTCNIKDLMFTMPKAKVTVNAKFEPVPTASAVSTGVYTAGVRAMEHGTVVVNPSQAAADTLLAAAVYPEEGYRFVEGTLGYYFSETGADSSFHPITDKYRLFYMPAGNILLYAVFEPIPTGTAPTYQVTTGLSQYGTLLVTPDNGPAGTEVTVLAIPVEGARFVEGSLKYRDATDEYEAEHLIDESDEFDGTFTIPAGDVFVYAAFEPVASDVFTVSRALVPGGFLVAKPSSGHAGDTIKITTVADVGYRLTSGSVQYTYTPAGGGTPVTRIVNNGTFILPAANVVVSAEFQFVSVLFTVSMASTPGGILVALA